jgi:short-subunit dehydrogenase
MAPRTILITGASSGIGASLARVYAVSGTTLLLWGRDAGRLDSVADSCRASGANVITDILDIRDGDALTARILLRDGEAPIDLAIFNAGLGGSAPAGAFAETPQAARATAEVNFVAPIIGAHVMADAMARRGRGQILLVGSIAESFPLAMAPTYAATKAGLAMFAESLGLRLARHGVIVTLVSPGFIDTPMSQQVTEPKPFLMTADAAARIIAAKAARGARRIVVPWQFAVIRGVAMLLPRPLLRLMLPRA